MLYNVVKAKGKPKEAPNMTQEQLIAYYENQLKKVEEQWGNGVDTLGNDGNDYIEFARRQLEEVKAGRKW